MACTPWLGEYVLLVSCTVRDSASSQELSELKIHSVSLCTLAPSGPAFRLRAPLKPKGPNLRYECYVTRSSNHVLDIRFILHRNVV